MSLKQICVVLCWTLTVPVLKCAGSAIDLSTSNASNWVITGAGAVAAPAAQVTGVPEISLTNSSFRTGTFVTGASSAQFTGLWYADAQFSIPANATALSLTFSSLSGDDRVVLQLNGNVIGNYYLGSKTGTGVMQVPPSTTDDPFVFTGTVAGTITNGLLNGAENDLRLVVNNTHAPGVASPTITYAGDGDGTWAEVTATVSYSVPEPGSTLFVGACLLIGLSRRRRRSDWAGRD